MGLFNNKYPYTDFHELNLDWIVEKMAKLDTDLDEIERRATEAAVAGAKEYVDQELVTIRAEFADLSAEVRRLEFSFDEKVAEVNRSFQNFKNEVNAQIALQTQRIDEIRAEINADIQGVNARTDAAIAQNNEYIFEELTKGFSELKVTNFFTGARVTVQQMLDYLATLHATEGLTYSEMAVRAKTYNFLVGLSSTYTNFVLNGKNIYV